MRLRRLPREYEPGLVVFVQDATITVEKVMVQPIFGSILCTSKQFRMSPAAYMRPAIDHLALAIPYDKIMGPNMNKKWGVPVPPRAILLTFKGSVFKEPTDQLGTSLEQLDWHVTRLEMSSTSVDEAKSVLNQVILGQMYASNVPDEKILIYYGGNALQSENSWYLAPDHEVCAKHGLKVDGENEFKVFITELLPSLLFVFDCPNVNMYRHMITDLDDAARARRVSANYPNRNVQMITVFQSSTYPKTCDKTETECREMTQVPIPNLSTMATRLLRKQLDRYTTNDEPATVFDLLRDLNESAVSICPPPYHKKVLGEASKFLVDTRFELKGTDLAIARDFPATASAEDGETHRKQPMEPSTPSRKVLRTSTGATTSTDSMGGPVREDELAARLQKYPSQPYGDPFVALQDHGSFRSAAPGGIVRLPERDAVASDAVSSDSATDDGMGQYSINDLLARPRGAGGGRARSSAADTDSTGFISQVGGSKDVANDDDHGR